MTSLVDIARALLTQGDTKVAAELLKMKSLLVARAKNEGQSVLLYDGEYTMNAQITSFALSIVPLDAKPLHGRRVRILRGRAYRSRMRGMPPVMLRIESLLVLSGPRAFRPLDHELRDVSKHPIVNHWLVPASNRDGPFEVPFDNAAVTEDSTTTESVHDSEMVRFLPAITFAALTDTSTSFPLPPRKRHMMQLHRNRKKTKRAQLASFLDKPTGKTVSSSPEPGEITSDSFRVGIESKQNIVITASSSDADYDPKNELFNNPPRTGYPRAAVGGMATDTDGTGTEELVKSVVKPVGQSQSPKEARAKRTVKRPSRLMPGTADNPQLDTDSNTQQEEEPPTLPKTSLKDVLLKSDQMTQVHETVGANKKNVGKLEKYGKPQNTRSKKVPKKKAAKANVKDPVQYKEDGRRWRKTSTRNPKNKTAQPVIDRSNVGEEVGSNSDVPSVVKNKEQRQQKTKRPLLSPEEETLSQGNADGINLSDSNTPLGHAGRLYEERQRVPKLSDSTSAAQLASRVHATRNQKRKAHGQCKVKTNDTLGTTETHYEKNPSTQGPLKSRAKTTDATHESEGKLEKSTKPMWDEKGEKESEQDNVVDSRAPEPKLKKGLEINQALAQSISKARKDGDNDNSKDSYVSTSLAKTQSSQCPEKKGGKTMKQTGKRESTRPVRVTVKMTPIELRPRKNVEQLEETDKEHSTPSQRLRRQMLEADKRAAAQQKRQKTKSSKSKTKGRPARQVETNSELSKSETPTQKVARRSTGESEIINTRLERARRREAITQAGTDKTDATRGPTKDKMGKEASDEPKEVERLCEETKESSEESPKLIRFKDEHFDAIQTRAKIKDVQQEESVAVAQKSGVPTWLEKPQTIPTSMVPRRNAPTEQTSNGSKKKVSKRISIKGVTPSTNSRNWYEEHGQIVDSQSD